MKATTKLYLNVEIFYSATVFWNLKTAFNGVGAIISKDFVYIFALTLL